MIYGSGKKSDAPTSKRHWWDWFYDGDPPPATTYLERHQPRRKYRKIRLIITIFIFILAGIIGPYLDDLAAFALMIIMLFFLVFVLPEAWEPWE